MRSTRATFFVVSMCLAMALFAAACSSADDVVIATDFQLGEVVVDGTGSEGGTVADTDDLSLRSSTSEEAEQASPGGVTGRPSPPTLATPAAEQPAPSSQAETTTTTVVTTTSSLPPSSEAETTSTSVTETVVSTSAVETSTGDTQPTSTPPSTEPLDLADGETRSLTLLNELRVSLELSQLTRNGEMDAFARDWSRQMAETGRFEHSSGPYGENIAFTSNTQLTAAEAADLFHQLWVDSAGHYANMTNGSYVNTGVGLYLTDRGWYGTHVFSY